MLGTSENCSTRPPKWSRRNETLIFKKWKIELYIFKYMFYYLYIYNNPSCVSRGLFLGSCNRLPDSELSTSGDCSTMLSAKRRFFTPPKWRLQTYEKEPPFDTFKASVSGKQNLCFCLQFFLSSP